MYRIVIPFFSASGATRALAGLIAEGISETRLANPVALALGQSGDADWPSLARADAIVFGSPTYMGGVAAPMKAFMDRTGDFWAEQAWADKLAAGFTCGANSGGDKLGALQQMAIFAAQHGMIWVGQNQAGQTARPDRGALNPDGFWLGLAATSAPDAQPQISPADAATARLFGARIAHATHRWRR